MSKIPCMSKQVSAHAIPAVCGISLCEVSSTTPDEKNFFCVRFQPPSLSSTVQTLRTLGTFRVDSFGSDTLQQPGLKQVEACLLDLPSTWSATR